MYGEICPALTEQEAEAHDKSRQLPETDVHEDIGGSSALDAAGELQETGGHQADGNGRH